MIVHESSSKATQRRIHAALTRFSRERIRLSPISLCYALRRIPRNARAAQSSSLHEAYSGSSNRKCRLTLLQLAAPVDSGTRGKRILWAPRPAHQANRGCIPDTWHETVGGGNLVPLQCGSCESQFFQISYAHDDADKGHSSILQYENSPSPLYRTPS